MKEKLVINLNKKIAATHNQTRCDSYDISDPKLIKSLTCFINWNEDRIEVNYEVNKQHQIKFMSQKISFVVTDRFTFQPARRFLSVVSADESANESSPSIVKTKLHASFFSTLLNIFSPHRRVINIELVYLFDFKTYTTTYLCTVPDIEQKEWYAKVVRLDDFFPSEIGGNELEALYNHNFALSPESSSDEMDLRTDITDYCNASTRNKFNDFDFLRMMKIAVAIEDLHEMNMMDTFTLENQKIMNFTFCPPALCKKIRGYLEPIMCQPKIEDLIKSSLVIICDKRKMPVDTFSFDSVHIVDQADYQNFHDDPEQLSEIRLTAKILYIFGHVVLVNNKKADRLNKSRVGTVIDFTRPYRIQFIPNRIAKRVSQRAIKTAADKGLGTFLKSMEDPFQVKSAKPEKVFNKLFWMNRTIRSNKEQQKAVINIVNKTSFPSPYVVFGPPGTGKSTTIIEAIAQIVKLKPNAHILVTAGSNSACDDVAVRLLKYISLNKIFRIYSPIYDTKPDKIDKSLENISNFRSKLICGCQKRSCPDMGKCDDPTYEEFCTANVIVCTLMSCGRIVSARAHWAGHFDYIFIDEAACQSEEQTLVPIVGLGMTDNRITAQIVLSGDHKQLGFIVKHKEAKKMGMETSMMERIMETLDGYKFKDPDYVTQLVQNYRSHPAIIEFSNQEFYEGKLTNKTQSSASIRNFAMGWQFLMFNKDFPVLFHTLQSKSEEQGTSLYNLGEAEIAQMYVRVLLEMGINGEKVEEGDIGVITPYVAQKYWLTQHLGSIYPKLEIGTVDAFQGREKKVIIINTVRSRTRHVGFLRSEKRLNVALTRAQSLLIIVGNSHTLQKSLIWNKFIAYCYNNRAIVGENTSFNREVVNNQHYTGSEIIHPNEPEDQYD